MRWLLLFTCKSALSLQGRLASHTVAAAIAFWCLVQRIPWRTPTWVPASIATVITSWAPFVWFTISFVTGAITSPWAVTMVWIINFMFFKQITGGFTQIRVTVGWFVGLPWRWPTVFVSVLSRAHLWGESSVRVWWKGILTLAIKSSHIVVNSWFSLFFWSTYANKISKREA